MLGYFLTNYFSYIIFIIGQVIRKRCSPSPQFRLKAVRCPVRLRKCRSFVWENVFSFFQHPTYYDNLHEARMARMAGSCCIKAPAAGPRISKRRASDGRPCYSHLYVIQVIRDRKEVEEEDKQQAINNPLSELPV